MPSAPATGITNSHLLDIGNPPEKPRESRRGGRSRNAAQTQTTNVVARHAGNVTSRVTCSDRDYRSKLPRLLRANRRREKTRRQLRRNPAPGHRDRETSVCE